MRSVNITKAFGQTELFSEKKLIRSLKRSGASDEVIQSVADEITAHVKEGMTTKEIYRQAFDLLRQYAPHRAAKYKLKQGINELGPTGFPFELYVAELFKAEGFTTQTGMVVPGHCVKHEVDVIAERDGERLLVECKYHNAQGIHCDVKIPLYIQSRFLDVLSEWKKEKDSLTYIGMVVTNTRFTDDAAMYGTCMGLRLIGWDYPKGYSLRERVNAAGLHPVTCLTTITSREKELLLDRKIVLCRQVAEDVALLGQIGITNKERQERIINECRLVINHNVQNNH